MNTLQCPCCEHVAGVASFGCHPVRATKLSLEVGGYRRKRVCPCCLIAFFTVEIVETELMSHETSPDEPTEVPAEAHPLAAISEPQRDPLDKSVSGLSGWSSSSRVHSGRRVGPMPSLSSYDGDWS